VFKNKILRRVRKFSHSFHFTHSSRVSPLSEMYKQIGEKLLIKAFECLIRGPIDAMDFANNYFLTRLRLIFLQLSLKIAVLLRMETVEKTRKVNKKKTCIRTRNT